MGLSYYNILILITTGSIFIVLRVTNSEEIDDEDEIFSLSKLINSGQFGKAKSLAKVKHKVIESYSGFLTVNESYNSNLFFWYFPTALKRQNKRRVQLADVPLILWLQGGPGSSSLFGLFVENGPFIVNSKLKLGLRDYPWTQTHSMLYIDSPVGTGFSFTSNEEFGYSKTENDVAHNLYVALSQFFKLFHETTQCNFYIAGESYAGKYIPTLAMKIHNENVALTTNKMHQQQQQHYGRNQIYINLVGLIIGAGFCDPINMVTSYGDYLYYHGLINGKSRAHFQAQGLKTQECILAGNYSGAYQIQDELFGGDFIPYPTYFHNVTGFEYYLNTLEPHIPEELDYYDAFVQLSRTRQLIHVRNVGFERQSEVVAAHLKNEIFKSVAPAIEQLLGYKYQMLFYVGQLDIVIPHVAVENFLVHLSWEGKKDFDVDDDGSSSKGSKILRNSDDEILGYLQQGRNLNYVIVRNAGHYVPFDQPKWILDIVTRFTRGQL